MGFTPGWKALGSIQIVAREFLDKLDDASPHPPVLYPHERLGERAPVARGEEFVHIGRRCSFSISLELPSVLWSAFEKEGHRDLQDMRDVLQAARPHAVGALLVFLNLLGGHAEHLPKLFLAHSEHLPAHPDPAAHVLVDRVLFDFLFHDTSELLTHGAAGSTLAGVTMVRLIYSAATSCVRLSQTRRRSQRRRPESGAACAARPPGSTSLLGV